MRLLHNWLVVLTILKNIKVNGKDYPKYYGKYKMFKTTNQIVSIVYVSTYIHTEFYDVQLQ